MTRTRLLLLTAVLLAGCSNAAPAAPATAAGTCPAPDDRLSQVLGDALAKAFPEATITGTSACDQPWRLRYAGTGALEAHLLVRDAAGTRSSIEMAISCWPSTVSWRARPNAEDTVVGFVAHTIAYRRVA